VRSLEDQIRALAERSVDAAERREAELGSVAYLAPRVRRRSSRLLAAAAAIVTLVAGVVVAAVAGDDDSPPPRRPVVASTVPQAPLRARLVLPSTRLRAGSQMSGEVIVDNDTGEPIEILACQSFYAVRLVNEEVQQDVAFLSCGGRFVIPVGRSRWPVGVSASFTGCGGEPPILPRCLPDGGMPPIPKGTYRAEVVDGGAHNRPVPIPDPVTITVE
jgi:hypothetical protein